MASMATVASPRAVKTAFIRSPGAMLPDGVWQLVWFDAVSTGQAVVGAGLIEPYDRTQHLDNIFRRRDERRAAFDEAIRAFGARIERMTGKREHLASELA